MEVPAGAGPAAILALMTKDVSIGRIREARDELFGRVHRTPMLSSATAARVIEAASGRSIGEGRLYLKAEHLQVTGSFKPRGLLLRLGALDSNERKRGVVTISAGNAGQAYAWAGRELGVPVTVVMPENAVQAKVDAVRGYGATVIQRGSHPLEAFEYMGQLADERGLTIVHPYDDPDVIAGHGSAGLEIIDDLSDVDVVVVPIGGGGLISGIAAAIRQIRPAVRIYGVEPAGADAMRRALDAGEPVPITPATIADGLSAPRAGEWTLELVQRYVEDVVVIDDPMILAGLRFVLERVKQVVEPAGAAALAALLFGRIPLRDGDRVCCVLSGGNVATERLGEFLADAAPLAVP
jgi:threonine dehydratase